MLARAGALRVSNAFRRGCYEVAAAAAWVDMASAAVVPERGGSCISLMQLSCSYSTAPARSGDSLLAGGIWAELRSWARFLLPSRYVAVFYRTPPEVATAMLKLAGVGPEDVVYDLGCGDGSIIMVAARLGPKRVVGIELDPQLAAAARRAVADAGLGGRAEIVCGDAAAADVSQASVLTLYLSASGNQQLLRALAPSLRPGTRVVSHYFPVAGWESALVARGVSRGVDLYCYRAP